MNKNIKKIVFKILAITIVCSSFLQSKNQKLPNDIRWVVNSDEYKLLCNQIYNEAILTLDDIVKQSSNLKSAAIIIDLDETVLDNSKYQVENFFKGESFNMKSWAKWVNRAEADLVPGVVRFIESIRKHNIQIVFISNRMHERLDATVENLKNLNIFDEGDIFLLRLDKSDKKHIRRNEVITGSNRMEQYGSFNIIMSVGDAMGDFDLENTDIKNIILPNPMYGKW